MALKKYPGFIDIHVHLRDPGATQKEDFRSGTRAAVAGGFTFVCDMPNNPTPTFTKDRLDDKIRRSKKMAMCDVGFHFGTNGVNTDEFPFAIKSPDIFGLKVYCNHTTGELLIENLSLLENVFRAWDSEKPILVHAENMQLAGVLTLAQIYKRRLHICHVSQQSEITLIRLAKQKMRAVTAGVTPHHLFLKSNDIKKLGAFGMVKPVMDPLRQQRALWEGLMDGTIDIVESDHAPHTKLEKHKSTPPSGVPGLETSLGLLLLAVHQKRLKESDVIRLLYTTPKKIFHIPEQPKTYVELDPQKAYRVGEHGYKTKCGWSPFDKWTLYGEVENVVIRGKQVYAKR
jgi:carbamoyl-phosphate synthase/aspartate carbamoyltransferase/dihydroorotase